MTKKPVLVSVILGSIVVLLVLVSCSKGNSDSTKEYESIFFLEDPLTGEEIPDTEVRFVKYTNGTFQCGQIVLEERAKEDAEEKCYDLIRNRLVSKIFWK